jgi:hypothetical protein
MRAFGVGNRLIDPASVAAETADTGRCALSQIHRSAVVCQAITELAVEMNASISADDFRC